LRLVHHKSGAEWREIKRWQLFFKKNFNANFALEKYNYNSKIRIRIIIILNYNYNSKLFLLCSGFVIVGKIIVSNISWWDLKTKQN
jgi:hypothetical protein